MRMSSLEFKKLWVGFERDLKEIEDNLLEAVRGKIMGKDRAEAIAAGNRKRTEYHEFLAKLDDLKRTQVIERFGSTLDGFESILDKLGSLSG